jgi:uncharacterized protein
LEAFLHNHNLWCINRYSTRCAFAVGTFAALMPVPFQSLLAVGLSIFFRANIPIAFAMCWVTNPFTMAPIFYICYNIGSLILNQPTEAVELYASFEWIMGSISTVGGAFLLGSLILAIFCSVFMFFAVDCLWRFSVMHTRQKRQKAFVNLKEDKTQL